MTPRFRLRTLLVVFALVGLYLCLQVNRARQNKRAIDAIHKLGGQIYCAHERTERGGYSSKAELPGPDWLRKLLGEEYFVRIESVNFSKSQISDDDLGDIREHLENLPELRELFFYQTTIGDEGIKHLRNLTDLELLGLGDTNVSDGAMPYIGGMRKLKSLTMWDVSVSDEGMKHIAGLSQLQELQISPEITDAGLVHLEHLAELRSLLLNGNDGITDRGLKSIEKLQNLDELHLPRSISDSGRMQIQDALPNATKSMGARSLY